MSAKQITWTASAAQVAALEKAATALNGVSWCEKDNTAESVFEQFIKWGIDDLLNNPKSLASEISQGIETNEEPDSEADNRKAREVYHAICGAFNVGKADNRDGCNRSPGDRDEGAKGEGASAEYWQSHPDMLKRVLSGQVERDGRKGEGVTK